MTHRPFPAVPVDWGGLQTQEFRRILAQHINLLYDGRLRSYGTVTLCANSTTTTLKDRQIGGGRHIHFTPTTANAAAAMTTLYPSAIIKNQATLTHDNTADADRIFNYLVVA